MSDKVKTWLKALAATAISGASNAVLLVIVAPDKFSFSDLPDLGRVTFAMTIVAVALYLQKSPLPNGNGK